MQVLPYEGRTEAAGAIFQSDEDEVPALDLGSVALLVGEALMLVRSMLGAHLELQNIRSVSMI